MTLHVPISRGQKRVLDELMCDGADNAEIADRLGLSIETVKTQLRRVMQTAGAPSRTALVVALFRGTLRVNVVTQPSVHRRFEEDAA